VCALDAGAFGACASPVNLTGLALGQHTFYVSATDAAGNPDPSPASHTWTVQTPADTTAPDTAITSGPAATTTSTSATFEFSASEAGSSFVCALDTGAFGACASPVNLTGLALGQHTFSVSAKDAAGNADPSPATYTWTIEAESLGLWYLHNYPMPPKGNTNLQLNLPLDQKNPTATTLYNYDTNVDGLPGRTILRGGSGASESDSRRYQNWLSAPLGSSAMIDGNVAVTFYTAMKNMTQGQGSVTVFLRDYDGASYRELCQGTLTQSNWQGSTRTWLRKTLSINCGSQTIPAGHRVEVKFIVAGSTVTDMLFGYDTTAHPSSVEFP
jgi:hypothetical protein